MRIIHDLKLDYDDVLICPQSSSGTSRKDVIINRSFTKFPHADNVLLDVVPIVASNMDTVGTFEMQRSLAQHRCITCLHKYYDITKLLGHYNIDFELTFFSFGMKERDLNNIETLYDYCINYTEFIPHICLDVANGYTDKFVSFANKVREIASKSIIMAGNIATPQMVERLIREGGVDICKIGIGPGCFVTGTKVVTSDGVKSIEDIRVGDLVLTHKGNFKRVLGIKSRKENNEIIEINGIRCTTNHKFYVIHTKYKDIVNEDNIEDYAEWIEAKYLYYDYCLVKIIPGPLTLLDTALSYYKYNHREERQLMVQDNPKSIVNNGTNFELVKINTIKTMSVQHEDVFDIEVEDDNSFCVEDSIAVHNSACTTRIVTGIGYPQLSALIECADAAHGTSRGYVCADGGCKTPGDVCKALCAGANFVMLGGMLAGTDECNGEWEFNNDGSKKHLTFYGMSSYEAQDKYNGKSDYRPSEGRCVKIPYKGPVSKVIQQITGGIRSCCTYIGASEIKHMSRCATFIRVNNTHNRVYENFDKSSTK